MEHTNTFDVLTGLPNRTLIYDCITQAFANSRLQNSMMAVCFMDLDNFKGINEQAGHNIGDKLLIQVSKRFQSAIRETDTIAHIGGDEFVLLLTDIVGIEDMKHTLKRILIIINQPYEIDGATVSVSTSIGVTVSPSDSVNPEVLVRHAIQAMCNAKMEGGNCFHLFDPVQYQQIRERHQFAKKMRHALRDGEMCLFYQPKVNMSTGTVVGMEALIRWKHPVKGILGPAEFLYLHDQECLHIEIGDWVIRNVMAQIRHWIKSDNLHMPVSVNIEVCHLKMPDFTKRIASILSEYSEIGPQFLELEILESTSINNLHQVSQTIEECRNLGVSFALDDFGTGYSSLTYLKHLPINALKIDQAFVLNILNNKGDLAVVEAMIGIADLFDLNVVAEGVETPEHGAMLMHLGCNVAQGYGISRPIPAEKVADWVRAYQPYPSWKPGIHIHKHKDQVPGPERQGLAEQAL